MAENRLYFPSGRSVHNCRKDAKRLAQQTNQPLARALDAIARTNGGAATWAKSLPLLKPRPATQPSASGPPRLMTHADIQAVMNRHPVTHFGYGPSSGSVKKTGSYELALRVGQEELMAHLDECNKALRFLAHVDKRKTDNPRVGTSYVLKHSATRYLRAALVPPVDTYVSNGALICAALHLGFVAKARPLDPNVTFNMSSRSAVFAWERLRIRGLNPWGASPQSLARLAELEASLGVVPRTRL